MMKNDDYFLHKTHLDQSGNKAEFLSISSICWTLGQLQELTVALLRKRENGQMGAE